MVANAQTTYKTKYHANGKISLEIPMVNEKVNGIAKVYREDGSLKTSLTYVDGKLNGVSKGYSEEGNLEYSAEYKNGETDGVFQNYYPSGKVKLKVNQLPNDIKTGTAFEYYENGKAKDIFFYKDGIPTGEYYSYDHEGNLVFSQPPG